MLFIDQLTKCLIVVTVKASTTDELNKLVETHLIPSHGYMDTLIADQGSVYTSNRFKEFAKERQINLNFVAKGNHKANGLTEKMVGNIH